MAKIKLLVVVNSEEMRLNVRQLLGKDEDIALLGFAAMDTAVLTKIAGYAPHVVLMVAGPDDAGVMDIAQRIYQGYKNCALILLTKQVNLALMQRAMMSGFRQVVDIEDTSTLKEAITSAALFEQSRTGSTRREPRVICVYGGKGGAGKTTVAVNLTTALAQHGYRTVLVDLCLEYGDAALLLGITAKDTIAELVQEKNSFVIDDIKSFIMQHSSGVGILCSPAAPEFAEYVTPKHVEALINIMRPYYDFVVVDLPGNLSDCTLAALENADNILLVSRLDISNLRAAKLALNILRTLQQEEKVLLLLNADHKSILTHKDFEQVLEIPISFILPEDIKTARLSQQRGIPFVTGMPRTPVSQAVNGLADYWRPLNDRRKRS